MTISEARRWARVFSRNAYNSAIYKDYAVDMAIQAAANELIRKSRIGQTQATAPYTSGTATIDFSAVSGFHPRYIQRAWIGDNTSTMRDAIKIVSYQDILDTRQGRGVYVLSPTNGPTLLAFTDESTGVLWPTPTENGTLTFLWRPLFTSWTVGTIYKATATATVAGGLVTALTVTSGGGAYASAPAVTFSGGGGTSAAATAVLDIDLQQVTSITITNAGTGYTTAPTVAIAGGVADVTLGLADEYLMGVCEYGAPYKLHQYEPEHAKMSQAIKASWQDFINQCSTAFFGEQQVGRSASEAYPYAGPQFTEAGRRWY